MSNSFGIRHIAQFILFVALQILLKDVLVLFEISFCYIYIAFLLFLPIDMNKVSLIFLGFAAGATVDVFYNTLGVHAAASVLLAYLRPYVLNLLTPRDGYDTNDSVNIHVMGNRWFLAYAFLLIIAHHAAVFFLESISFVEVGYMLSKIFLSALFTCVVVVILQLLFFSVKRASR